MINKPQIANRQSQILTGAYLAFLLFLVATSSPRRVGDGGEYLAMAMNLAAWRPPALSPSDLHRVERRFVEIGHGYEVVPLDMPALGGRDGRQDFPHFWLYPLLAAPALWIVSAAGVHPNFAFVILNVALACGAFALLARRASPSIAILILAGPVIWWIDKAHGDVFTVSLLAIAFASLAAAPGAALIALGAAAAQNPPLAPIFVLCLALVWIRRIRRPEARSPKPGARSPGPEARSPRPEARLLTGAAIGLALAALPFIYYEWRLGVPTPIVGWTALHVPTLREMGAFIWDPNIGLAVNNPVFVIAVITAALVSLKRRRLTILSWWLPLACALVLLAGFAQSLNINHGATPGMNRWTLWLMALAVPLLTEIEFACAPTRALGAAAIASTLWSASWFQPGRGESYTTPTRTAQVLWSRAPWLDNPPPEIFAERVSGAEPAGIPVATPDCRKVLAIGGLWPVPCLPPQTARADCMTEGSACYANEAADGYRFTEVRFPAGLDFRRARAWPLDDRFARHLRSALDELGIQGLAPAAAGEPGAMLRAAHGVAWTYALQASDRLFVYVPDGSPDAVLTLRLPGVMGGAFVDLQSGERVVSVVRGGEPWAAWDVKVPAGHAHLALLLKRSG